MTNSTGQALHRPSSSPSGTWPDPHTAARLIKSMGRRSAPPGGEPSTRSGKTLLATPNRGWLRSAASSFVFRLPVGCAVLALAGLAGMAGCQSDGLPWPQLSKLPAIENPDGTQREVMGDWNDSAASMDIALNVAEMAPLGLTVSPDGRIRRQALITIEGQEGVAELRRVANIPAPVRGVTVDRALTSIEQADPERMKVGPGLGTSRGTMEPDPDELPPESIVIWVKVGPNGDKERERRLVDAIEARFADLRGKGDAPIRSALGWPPK
jgi:hypothetical protein